MALKPRRISLSPRVKPRLPVEVDRQHPLLRGVLYAQWMLNRAGVPTAEIGNRLSVLNSSVTWTNDGVTFNADGYPQYANSGGWSLAQSEKWTIVGRGTKFTNSPIGFEFFTALVDITNPSVKQVGIGFSNTNALKILSSGNTPGDDGVAITNGTTVDFALVHHGNGLLSCYKNGNFRYSVTHNAPSELNGLNRVWLATNPGGNTGNAVVNIEYVLIFRRALIPAEIRALHADPYAPIRKRRVLVPVATPTTGVSLTGTVQAQPATATGVLAVERVLTSAVQAQPSTTTGTITRELPLSGAVQAQQATTSWALATASVLSGSVQAQPATTTGALGIERTLNGAVQAQPSATTGTITTSANVATGAVQAQPATTAGVLVLERLLSGAVQAQRAITTGTFGIERVLNGAVQARHATTAGAIDSGALSIIPAGRPKRGRRWYRARLSDGTVIVSSQRVQVERRITREVVSRSRPEEVKRRVRLRPTRQEKQEIQQALSRIERVEYPQPAALEQVIADLKRDLATPAPQPKRAQENKPTLEWWRDPEFRARMTVILMSI